MSKPKKLYPHEPQDKSISQLKWIQNSLREGSILEESLTMLHRNQILQQELGINYSQELIVRDKGSFVLETEEEKLLVTFKKALAAKFNYILKVNQIETELTQLISSPNLQFETAFTLVANLLGYYGLAKAEAELIFAQAETTKQDNEVIGQWRNSTTRWQSLDNLWEIISDQIKIPGPDLHFLLINEVKSLINEQKVNLDIIPKRQNSDWSLLMKNKKITLFLEDLSPAIPRLNIKVLQGQVAYSNGLTIKGTIGKDILVARMTKPDMISEIKDSKAVITDEGGILSHAAISCREFKIPCIVGTKIATKVLKDGDLVEIDTVAGMINILDK